MAVYETSTTVQNTPANIAAFLRDPDNLTKITLPKIKLKLIAVPEELVAGSEIEFEVTHFGQTQRAKHKVTESTDERTAEEQIEGPMQSWTQSREYVVVDDGTEIRTKIEFEPPGGLLGLVLTPDLIRKMLAEGFEYQHQQLAELLNKTVD